MNQGKLKEELDKIQPHYNFFVNPLSLAHWSLHIVSYLQSKRAITLQCPNWHEKILLLEHLQLLINIFAKHKVNQVETVGGVQCTKFCRQTDRKTHPPARPTDIPINQPVDRLIPVFPKINCLGYNKYDACQGSHHIIFFIFFKSIL